MNRAEQDEGKSHMGMIWDEIKYDLEFLRGHTLQPKWFKVLKVFILLGVFAGYYALFGLPATILFIVTFFTLMLVVHFAYRRKTKKYTTSWLDFVVAEEGKEAKPKRIGKYYYPAVAVSTVISVIVSQVFA
jgi:uncharacterized membrane protein YfcA